MKYQVGIDWLFMCKSEVETEAVPSQLYSYPSTYSAVYTRMNAPTDSAKGYYRLSITVYPPTRLQSLKSS
jgi:hypothetical protein